MAVSGEASGASGACELARAGVSSAGQSLSSHLLTLEPGSVYHPIEPGTLQSWRAQVAALLLLFSRLGVVRLAVTAGAGLRVFREVQHAA